MTLDLNAIVEKRNQRLNDLEEVKVAVSTFDLGQLTELLVFVSAHFEHKTLHREAVIASRSQTTITDADRTRNAAAIKSTNARKKKKTKMPPKYVAARAFTGPKPLVGKKSKNPVLTNRDRVLASLLHHQTPQGIAKDTGLNVKTVSSLLSSLKKTGHAVNPSYGVWSPTGLGPTTGD